MAGKAWRGVAWRGPAWPGRARQGKSRQGKSRLSGVTPLRVGGEHGDVSRRFLFAPSVLRIAPILKRVGSATPSGRRGANIMALEYKKCAKEHTERGAGNFFFPPVTYPATPPLK